MDWKGLIGHRVFKLISAGTFAVSVFLVQPFRPVVFVGKSMLPTYKNHEFAIATTDTRDLNIGDVVVIESPHGTMVKRIAYLPGDWVDYYFLSGEWNYGSITNRQLRRPSRIPTKKVRVPEGYVFVLGDNPFVSLDSRVFGVLPKSSIRAKLVDPRNQIPMPINYESGLY